MRSDSICLSVPGLFTEHYNVQVHPCHCKWQDFLFKGEECVCVYIIPCIHLSEGFHVFITNNAALNMGITELLISFLSAAHSELLYHMVLLFQTSWGTFILFSIVVACMYDSCSKSVLFLVFVLKQLTLWVCHDRWYPSEKPNPSDSLLSVW